MNENVISSEVYQGKDNTNLFFCDKLLSSSQVLHDIDVILKSDLSFDEDIISTNIATSSIPNFHDRILMGGKLSHPVQDCVIEKNNLEVSSHNMDSDSWYDDSKHSDKVSINMNYLNLDVEGDHPGEVSENSSSGNVCEALIRSRQDSLQINETDFESSFWTVPSTRSNTESFSELRFSVSETHSDLYYSDSDSHTSEATLSTSTREFNLIDQFPDITNYKKDNIDDTTGILYEISEQINKVPKLLSGVTKQNISPELSIFNSLEPNTDACSDLEHYSSDTLEEKVFQYFIQCDQLSLTGLKNSKGNEELGQIEAAVERMLNQVEIQENLIKEDVSFVPLVLEKKEVDALPLLVDTLCLSPMAQRKPIGSSQLTESKMDTVFGLTKNEISQFVSDDISPPNTTLDDKINISYLKESCSIGELERTVNRLLNEVEKEEEKLQVSSPDSRKTLTSTTTTDMSSEDDSYGVWWEGAYRSLPRHSARKRLSKSSPSYRKHLLKVPKNTSWSKENTSDDSDTSKESVMCVDRNNKPHTKLMVKTTENGKSAIEIRTCNDLTLNPVQEMGSNFSTVFNRLHSEVHSIWNRSLPSLRHSPSPLRNSVIRSLGSDDSINYIKYMEPSECIQYFTPCATMDLDSTGYCTWTQRCSGGESAGEESSKSPAPATVRESEEALLDLATGIHDAKGSSSGSGPSSAK
uniref:Uncharacterized protein n=1 Tax=Graphocephala atropunctata TaxID=36148 RepID=A0A1B6LC09_9HEMI